jgi:hypothetical protein
MLFASRSVAASQRAHSSNAAGSRAAGSKNTAEPTLRHDRAEHDSRGAVGRRDTLHVAVFVLQAIAGAVLIAGMLIVTVLMVRWALFWIAQALTRSLPP